MRLMLPRLRFRVLTLVIVVAACALILAMWRDASPTRQWTEQLRSGRTADDRREAALRLGFDIPSIERGEAFRSLESATKDPDPSVREVVAMALAMHKDRAAVSSAVLASMLDDPMPAVRRTVVVGLGQMIEAKALVVDTVESRLIAALDDPDASVRLEAARLLVIGPKRSAAIPALARIVREKHGILRSHALAMLLTVQVIPRGVEETLLKMVASGPAAERLLAARALVAAGQPAMARPALRSLAEGPDGLIREEAEALLRRTEAASGSQEP